VPHDIFNVMCGAEIHCVIIRIYVTSDIHRIKRLTCDKMFDPCGFILQLTCFNERTDLFFNDCKGEHIVLTLLKSM
jgi:hypothetical protein